VDRNLAHTIMEKLLGVLQDFMVLGGTKLVILLPSTRNTFRTKVKWMRGVLYGKRSMDLYVHLRNPK